MSAGIDLEGVQFPHCDQAVLHMPSECRYCDGHPDWQELRELWGIAFTGHDPEDWQVPCPSDVRRGRGGAHLWSGNRPAEVSPGPPGPNPRPGFDPTGREPQRSFPVEARSWLPWRRRRNTTP